MNVSGSMWRRCSDEAFLYCDLHGCSNVSAADDLAGVCPRNAASRRGCRGGSDDTADTHAQVAYSSYALLCTCYCTSTVTFDFEFLV